MEKNNKSIASCKREWVSNTPTGLVDHSSFANCSRSFRFEGSLPHCWFEIPPQVFRIQIWTHCWPFQNSPALCLLPFIVLFEVCCTPKLFGNHQISWYHSHSQDIQCRGLHGLKIEARTWPVPEIVWPDPSGTVKFRAQTRNIFPPTTNSKKEKAAFHDCMQRSVNKETDSSRLGHFMRQNKKTLSYESLSTSGAAIAYLCQVYECCMDNNSSTVQIMVIFVS